MFCLEEEDFEPPLERLDSQVLRGKEIVFICNPNNPPAA